MSFEEWLGDYELPAKVKTKWCPECQEVLPEQCFHKNKATRDKLAKVCKRCSLVNVNTVKALKELHPKHDCCDICGATDRTLLLDHCHETKEFRGWLCIKCNTAIGYFHEDLDLMYKAINYVKECKPQTRYGGTN
tara:strand:- start:247 stop:651 length:405 start_codon:yes stop_codon:yes gene_type:complete